MKKSKRNSVINTDAEQLNSADTEFAEIPVQGHKHRRYTLILITVLLFLASAMLLVGTSFSWFAPKHEADLTVLVTDFSTETKYSISGSNYEVLTAEIPLSVSNISSLKLRVDYTGPSLAYIRVQLFDSFKDSNGKSIPSVPLNYTLSSNWMKYGDYYYYKQPITYTTEIERDENGNPIKDENNNNVTKIVPTQVDFVTSVSLDTGVVVQDGAYVNLVPVVEAVQPDRFDEFFGVSYDEVFGS